MTIEDHIKSLNREIAMRKRVYPGFVARGKMTGKEADHEIDAMEAVLATLTKVKEMADSVGRLF